MCYCVFRKGFAPYDGFTEQLQMFWPRFESQFVPSFSSLQKCILTEHFFSDLLKSDPSFLGFFIPLSACFQLLANHFLLSESNLCVLAQWYDLLVKTKADSKPFTAVLDQNQLMWVCGMGVMCEVSESLSAHLPFTPNSHSEPVPVTLAHVSWNRESDLWS